MADAKYISVETQRRSFLKQALAHLVVWSLIVGAVGASRVWFGGAWVIDALVFILAVVFAIAQVYRANGTVVGLTRAECAAWAAAGMPADVRAWKAGRDATR